MNYTIPKLAKELNCDKSKIINCIKYLHIKENGLLKKNTPYYNENETEHEVMMKNKIYRIYDCGTIKVQYNP